MTKDEIISMAHKAGGLVYGSPRSPKTVIDVMFTPETIERFTSLVATAERRKHQADIEKWKTEAATAEKWRGLALSKEGNGRTVQRIQQEAAELEREACAQTCEARHANGNYQHDTRHECAEAIRARGVGASIQPPAHQEPVAWIEHEWSGTGLRHLHFEKREPMVRDEVVNPVWTPLYTAPPQLQPLTDEQIWADDGIMSANAKLGLLIKDIALLVRAIESAHGITWGQQ